MRAPAADPHPIVADLNRRTVARLWAERKDTIDIAEATGLPEAEVCQILAHLQDERHAARIAGARP
ncbi:hypothetical protein [Methylorubrum sp. SB2]|uniref:hypothetical protein n=1 Tax=Methylorubrum subtropicum TaxID=3138812 RepID=UPI00313E698B